MRERLRARVATACLAAAVALGLGLVACGGESDPLQTTAPAVTSTGAEGESDAETQAASDGSDGQHAAIEDALEAVLAPEDAASVCASNITPRYLRKTYGEAQRCEREVADSKPAQAVRLREVVVLPDSVAQALMRPRGGSHDGKVLRAELVLDDETWRLDSLRSNVPVGP